MCGALGVALVLLHHVQLLNAEGANSLCLAILAAMLSPMRNTPAYRGPPSEAIKMHVSRNV